MRKYLTVLLIFVIPAFANAQSVMIDSLQQLLAKEKTDTGRVMLLSELSRAYGYSNPDTALSIATKGLELARQVNFQKGEANCLRATGNVFNNTGNYPRALELFLQALKIAEEIHDDKTIGSILTRISDLYFFQGDVKRSLDYAYRAIAILEKIHDDENLITILLNTGDSYEKQDMVDSAMVYTRRAYRMAVSRNDINFISIALNNLGNVYSRSGDLDSAMLYYKSAIPLLDQAGNSAASCEAFLGLGKIFLKANKTDSGLYYAKLSFTTAKSSGFTDYVLTASKFLADHYRSVQNIDSAYVYQSAAIVAKDSLFSQQKSSQIQNMTFNESFRQQQIAEARRHERAKIRQNALIGGLVTLLLVAFLLYRNNRQKQKTNLALQKQKEEIDTKAKNVELLAEIGRKITSSLSVETIISTVYDNVNSLMDATIFGIGIYHDESKTIDFPATYENGEALPAYSNSIDDQNRFAVLSFNNGKEIVMSDLSTEYNNHLQQLPIPLAGDQPVSLIYLPLKIKEKKLGVITVQSFKKNAFSDYHLYMLRTIAVYTSIALENAESFKKLNTTLDSLRTTQRQLIQSEKMASLGELTAGIAHEIQNPLNFVNNFSDINKELIDEATHILVEVR